MKVIFDGKYDYPDQIYSWINYDKFIDDKKNLVYVYGIFADDLPEGYKNYIYYNVEEPNGLYHSAKLLHDRELNNRGLNYNWTKILQMDPYSTEWLVKELGYENYVFSAHFPLWDFKFLPEVFPEKIYDVMYQGSIYGPDFSSYIDVMKKYKYVWTSQSTSPDPRKTHFNLPISEKIKLMLQSKINVIDNRVFEPYTGAFLRNVSQLPKWNKNEAFTHVHEGFMPQFKVKAIEQMLTKNLCLVRKSEWDIMERMGFKEGEHFFYFENVYELDGIISQCLEEWDACQPIIENAYEKVKSENSSESFYNKYLKPYDE
jgi:hypothetical protein